MIDLAIAILQQAGFDLTAREIAEILWLAVHIDPSERSLSSSSDEQKQQSPQAKQPQIPETPEASSLPEVNEPAAQVYLPSNGSSNANAKESRETIPFKAPAAASLRNSLELARSLRPLMRKVPSSTEAILDEEATVYRIAEEDIWVPVVKPAPERWLELALVVEQTSTTAIWKQTINELQQLLKYHGAFRDVRTWQLKVTETKAELFPQNSTGSYDSTPQSPKVLIDPKGRRLILLVSDCISPAWRNKLIHPTLELWERNGLITILQLLPERLWSRTALAEENPIQLSSLTPIFSNTQLIAKIWDEDEIDEDENQFQIQNLKSKIPIITLEPEPILIWSRVLAGQGNTATLGFNFSPNSETQTTPPPTPHSPLPTPHFLVSRFRATASPVARRLAGLMAVAPVSLPVVHLIQQNLLPESAQIHVAEVFMSGLLKRQNSDTDYIEYEFFDGVRDLLLDSVPISKQKSVDEKLTEFLAKRFGLSVREFEARLRIPPSQAQDNLESQIRPFAHLKAQVLRKWGGVYAKIAEQLTQVEQVNLSVLLHDIVVRDIKKWFDGADIRLDTLVVHGNAQQDTPTSIYLAQTFRFSGIKSGDRLPIGKNGLRIFHGQPLHFLDIFITVSRDRKGSADLATLLNQQMQSTEMQGAVGTLLGLAVAAPQVATVTTAISSASVLGNLAYQVLSKATGDTIGLYRTSWLQQRDGFGIGRHPEEGSHHVKDLSFWYEIIEENQNDGQISVQLKTFTFETVTVNRRGEIIKRESKQAQYFIENLGDDVTLEMVSIPGGKFMMGSPPGEGHDDEKPQHEVTVPSFFMGKYPITQAQWRAVAALPKVERDLKPDPSYFKGDRLPVECVSWFDAVEFCARLSNVTGKIYRLPSEAEWEYACRAGTKTPFHFGETITDKLANYDGSVTFAEEPEGEYREKTTNVGNFSPNAFGLYDMHGNVWEWNVDDWHEDYEGAPIDGTASIKKKTDNDNKKLLRGGSWFNLPDGCRSACRYWLTPVNGNDYIGFRVVCGAAPRTLQ